MGKNKQREKKVQTAKFKINKPQEYFAKYRDYSEYFITFNEV